ncbi:MAG: ImmA/IrrE family metallo-endopeptidase [Telmatospirillum sp.]|nr:ImmA/IrrE family metallo-endopeptidase [Telmatospirillum sp.]
MAARVMARIKPEVLVWARTSSGFGREQAAMHLGIDDARLAAWEAGDDAPSIPQLRKLATLYKRPLAVFYLQEVPAGFQVLRDLRRLPGTGFRYLPASIQIEIRRASQRRELALEMLDELGEEVAPFRIAATVSDDPEEIGIRIRTALGVTEQVQASWRDPDGRAAFNAWRSRIEEAAVLVFQATQVSSEDASGFAIAESRLPVIVINRKDPPTRRTFSLLHEFTHLMLRVSGVSDLEADAIRPPEDQAIEVFCNQVAAAALMPRSWLLTDSRIINQGIRSTNWSDPEISDLARMFGVSREAVVRRLLTFDRTTETFYRAKRSQYAAERALREQRQREKAADSEIRRNMPQETLSNFGRPLVHMILGNYYQDRLSLSEVAGYLGIKTKHIPKLENLTGLR